MAVSQQMIIKNNTYINSTVIFDQQKDRDPDPLSGFFNLTETIVGRDDDEEKILNLLQTSEKRRLLITGIGGIGKTFLAMQCAKKWVETQNIFKYAVFVSMDREELALKRFNILAEKILFEKVKDKDNIQKVYERYNKEKSLFVLDNIEQNGIINEFLPSEELTNIYVLGTSQCIEYKQIFKTYSLDKLDEAKSLQLVLGKLKEASIMQSSKLEEMYLSILVGKLDYHPLSLQNAIASIIDTIQYEEESLLSSLKEYLKEFNARLQTPLPDEYKCYYSNSIYIALRLNIEKTIKEDRTRQILFCMAYLHPDEIYLDILQDNEDFKQYIKKSIRFLKKHSLISVNDENLVKIHRLIQVTCRILINESPRLYDNLSEESIIKIIFKIFMRRNNFDNDYHFSFLVKNIMVNRKTLSNVYVESFRESKEIQRLLSDKLTRIGCSIQDTISWSVLHCSIFVGHMFLYNYFNEDLSAIGILNDGLERFENDLSTWTEYHVQFMKDKLLESFQKLYSCQDLFNLFFFIKKDINTKGVKGFTLLNFFVACGIHVNDLKRIIEESSFDLNMPDDFGFSPLMWAIKTLNFEVVFELLSRGVESDNLLLLFAAKNNQKSLLDILQQADISIDDNICNLIFLWACAEGHLDLISILLSRSVDVNVYDIFERSALFLASTGGHLEIVKTLINKGSKIDIPDMNGNTPIIQSARNGHCEILCELIKKDANINNKNNIGDTPLMVAIQNGHVEVVHEIIKRKSDVNDNNNLGYSPLLLASEKGLTSIVSALIKINPNVINIYNIYGRAPLHEAVSNGHLDVVKILLETGANINKVDGTGNTPLSISIGKGHHDIANFLIDNGAAVCTVDCYGCTPILRAVINGSCDFINKLIEKGESVNSTCYFGNTPLLMSLKCERYDIGAYLIEMGADINIINKAGESPLVITSHRAYVDAVTTNNPDKLNKLFLILNIDSEPVKRLIRNSSDDDLSEHNIQTSKLQSIELLIKLIEKGANVHVKNRERQTALTFALMALASCTQYEEKHKRAVFELLTRRAPINTKNIKNNTKMLFGLLKIDTFEINNYQFAANLFEIYIETIINLIDNGVNVNDLNVDSNTPLILAAKHGYSEVVNKLIEKGCNINATNKFDMTPLMAALFAITDVNFKSDKHIKIIAEFIKKEAQIITTDKNKNTFALFSLLSIKKEEITNLGISEIQLSDLISVLINAGVNVDSTDTDGNTLLLVASKNKHYEAAVKLIEINADVCATDRDGNTPLWWATNNQDHRLQQVLTSQGASTHGGKKFRF